MTSIGGRSHDPAVLAWHGVCALGMAVMALPTPPWWPRVAAVLFSAGVLWCAVRVRRGGDRAAYLGLGVCCLTMVVMLVPALDWVVGTAPAGMPVTPVGPALMPMSSGAGPTAHASVPTGVVVVLALALTVLCVRAVTRSIVVVRGSGWRPAAGSEAVSEALLAGAMAAMLVAAH